LKLTEQAKKNPKLFTEAGGVAALGILWNQDMDDLVLRASMNEINTKTSTKRSVLLYIANLTVGWSAPLFVVAKICCRMYGKPMWTEIKSSKSH